MQKFQKNDHVKMKGPLSSQNIKLLNVSNLQKGPISYCLNIFLKNLSDKTNFSHFMWNLKNDTNESI